MRLLILGGTADGRHMADELHSQFGNDAVECGRESVTIVYSVAGLVRVPNVSCDVISGGFTQYGGLTRYIKDNAIDALLDMTHPYALRMSRRASEAGAITGIPCWRFHRSAWVAGECDKWFESRDWPELLAQLKDRRSILITAGQMDSEVLDLLTSMYAKSHKSYVLRTAVEPRYALPSNMQWIKAIGPFFEPGEETLMRKFGIDALVSKNSGGESTSAKLSVARKMGIPVYMLSRPELVTADCVFTDVDQCRTFVLNYFKQAQGSQTLSAQIYRAPDDGKLGTSQ